MVVDSLAVDVVVALVTTPSTTLSTTRAAAAAWVSAVSSDALAIGAGAALVAIVDSVERWDALIWILSIKSFSSIRVDFVWESLCQTQGCSDQGSRCFCRKILYFCYSFGEGAGGMSCGSTDSIVSHIMMLLFVA